MADFRKDDEEVLKDLREKIENVRLDESPDDIGSSSNKREFLEEKEDSSLSKILNKKKS